MRRKQETLRFTVSIGWGVVAMITAVCGLWHATNLAIEYVVFYSLFAYFIALGIALIATEPKRAKSKKRAVVAEPGEFKMYNMRRGRWENVR